jgi:hypothetical protein
VGWFGVVVFAAGEGGQLVADRFGPVVAGEEDRGWGFAGPVLRFRGGCDDESRVVGLLAVLPDQREQ